MPSHRIYWEGEQRAIATSFTYSAYGVDAAKSLEAINLAFAVYYAGILFSKTLNRIRPGSGAAPMADLRDAACAGWGLGVHDLDDAFHHVAKSGGEWSDYHNAQYFGTFGSFSSFIPLAAANFLKAVDTRIAAAKALQAKQATATTAIKAAEENPVWVTVAGHVKTVGEGIGEFQKYSWILPAVIASKSANLAFAATDAIEIVEKVNEVAGLFLTAASETQSACESFDKAMRAGFSTQEAILLTSLQRIAAFVPVLGDFYSQAIGLIPTITDMMNTIAEHKAEMLRLAQYGPTHGQQMRYLGSN